MILNNFWCEGETRDHEAKSRDSSLPVVEVHGPNGSFEVGGRLLLDLIRHRVDLEAVESGHELIGGPLRPVLGVDHEEHVGEAGAEVGPVDVVVAGRLGSVHVAALRAVQLHHRLARNVAQTNRQHRLKKSITL